MVMDADDALGLVISRHAIDAAIDLAKTYGLGAVAGAQQQRFRRRRLLRGPRRPAGADRLRLHQCLARHRADRLEGGVARHQSDRRWVPPGPMPIRIVVDMATSVVARSAHPLHAGARTEDAARRLGARPGRASRPPIRRWR